MFFRKYRKSIKTIHKKVEKVQQNKTRKTPIKIQ